MDNHMKELIGNTIEEVTRLQDELEEAETLLDGVLCLSDRYDFRGFDLRLIRKISLFISKQRLKAKEA